jgi:hypothetical protein
MDGVEGDSAEPNANGLARAAETEKVCFNGGLVALGRHTSVAKFVSDSVDSSSGKIIKELQIHISINYSS